MKIKFLGHSAFLIEERDIRIIIDPFLSDNPQCNIAPETLDNISYILVTHGHADHIGDTKHIAERNNSDIICNVELGWYFSSLSLKVLPMHIGGIKKIPFGSIKMTPALHGSGIKVNGIGINGGNSNGFIIEVSGKKVYHAGDTGLSVEMQLLKRENIDVALLPIGGNFTMGIDDAIIAASLIEPKLVIPMHYNTFDVIKVNPHDFKAKMNSTKTAILDINEEIII